MRRYEFTGGGAWTASLNTMCSRKWANPRLLSCFGAPCRTPETRPDHRRLPPAGRTLTTRTPLASLELFGAPGKIRGEFGGSGKWGNCAGRTCRHWEDLHSAG